MAEDRQVARYRFGVFEVDAGTGELRQQGMRVRLHAQPFALLLLLLDRPGEVVTREEIRRVLWPEGTFVDYEHGVNSALNRLREALGDKANQPRFVETLARRGYRFLAPVERLDVLAAPVVSEPAETGLLDSVLATPEDLPTHNPALAKVLFLLLQAMYLGFYVGALANLAEIEDLTALLPHARFVFLTTLASAAAFIPLRAFLLCGVLFRAPGMLGKYLRLWPLVLVADLLWSLAPFLLLHHMNYGVAIACVTLLVYAPFAQRSLMLMGERKG